MDTSGVYRFFSKFFDEDGADVVTYAFYYIMLWLVLFFAINFITDHMKWFNATIYDFPIDPAREPIPNKEVINE